MLCLSQIVLGGSLMYLSGGANYFLRVIVIWACLHARENPKYTANQPISCLINHLSISEVPLKIKTCMWNALIVLKIIKSFLSQDAHCAGNQSASYLLSQSVFISSEPSSCSPIVFNFKVNLWGA